jgi:environmental stress-induced protein Ves
MLPSSLANKLQIIRRSSYTAVPWKNGGGVTHEAIRVPPAGESFSWRVSVAHIESSGAFSDFSGYERKMVLLEGRGLDLKFGDGRRRELRHVGDWVEFDGAISTHCELLDGPCVDLNLMTSKSLKTCARVEHLSDRHIASASAGDTVLIFSLEAPLLLAGGSGESARLEPWDLAVSSLGTAQLDISRLEMSSHPAAVFIASISQ